MYKTTGEAGIPDTPEEAPRSIAKPLPPERFIDYRAEDPSQNHPVKDPGYNAEMRWRATTSSAEYLTPTENFFVRSHAPTPFIDAATWELKIEGPSLGKSLGLGYGDLLGLPSVSITKALECAGNGRVFFDENHGREAPGTPWRLGAVGVAEWTGVPLREILERANMKPSARDIMAGSLDGAGMRRPLPVEKALDDAIVAYGMNGEPLMPDHGFPARLIVPGWAAVASVKWLGRLFVSDERLFSPWNTEQYVLTGDGHDGSPVTRQVVKSALELAWNAEIPAGENTIRGRSWSPTASIARVECALDGEEWREAAIEAPNLPGAWATWSFSVNLSPGGHTLRVRATDTDGDTQPEEPPFNDLGYLYGGVVGFPIRAIHESPH
ncbi:MAG: sulfite oxidase [Rubrobacter sp.]|nr:sulfite oxidase [Rubrobacter sp.]